jgi:ribosomal protein S18 acetylase RimI-like enzyme
MSGLIDRVKVLVGFSPKSTADIDADSVVSMPSQRLINEMQTITDSIKGSHLRLMRDGADGVYLHTLQVAPSFRRRGIGTAVMEELIRLADELDVRLLLNSSPLDGNDAPDHVALTRFYERFGFEEDWDYSSDVTAAFDGPRDGTWTRMVRRPACATLTNML